MGNEWQTRQTLLMRAKNQDDDAAWEEFVKYYHDFIVMVLRQMNLYSGDFDDLTQDILIKIWKNLPAYIYDEDRSRFRTWLSRLIRNQVLNHIRATQRRNRKHTEALEDETAESLSVITEPDVEKIIEKEWMVYITRLALKNISSLFSERAIEAFSMSIDGKSTAQIAEHLGVKPNSVVKLRNRIKERLVKEIRFLREELEPE
ncbi:ECF RNA polymerase sigma factor SigE [Pontiella desulfatans]|uniref:RNA polymerase sigma factor SigS n=1 Tax=Pontiella desulfatans TaxID=2750659 RepID=A0A6C2U6K7_PONDE|nr:sigma-70 family RNA polymerase sigma factor [Pontiella desulfatans]VGO15650.1 ECF RNA polymerase sigma factor SigE [Pontiella desulfatans]